MKKLLLIGLVISLTSGCCNGWRPFRRGAACRTPALPAAPMSAPSAGCTNCGPTSLGYAEYPGSIGGGEYYGSGIDDYYGGTVIEDGIIDESDSGPPMERLPSRN
jgi:hypothetical protein